MVGEPGATSSERLMCEGSRRVCRVNNGDTTIVSLLTTRAKARCSLGGRREVAVVLTGDEVALPDWVARHPSLPRQASQTLKPDLKA